MSWEPNWRNITKKTYFGQSALLTRKHINNMLNDLVRDGVVEVRLLPEARDGVEVALVESDLRKNEISWNETSFTNKNFSLFQSILVSFHFAV